MNDYIISPMLVSDIAETVAIEKDSFSVPWTSSAFSELLSCENARFYCVRSVSDIPCYDSGGFKNIPAGTVAGYAGLYYVLGSVSDDGSVIDPGGGDILNIAVRRELRRRGIARFLLDNIVLEAKTLALSVLMLEVRRSNEPARALYTAYGFREVGVRKNYYSKPREDAILMNLELDKQDNVDFRF